jgi:hypothetical protein
MTGFHEYKDGDATIECMVTPRIQVEDMVSWMQLRMRMCTRMCMWIQMQMQVCVYTEDLR